MLTASRALPTLPATADTAADTAAGGRVGPWQALVLTGVMARVQARIIQCTAEGLVFHSDRAFPPGTRLKLLVALHEGADTGRARPLTLPVRVCSHGVRGMAFCMHGRFEALDDQTRCSLQGLLLQQTSTC